MARNDQPAFIAMAVHSETLNAIVMRPFRSQVSFDMLELLDDVRHTLLAHGLKPISPFSCRWVSANESERLYHVL